jgi:hypothetical protein
LFLDRQADAKRAKEPLNGCHCIRFPYLAYVIFISLAWRFGGENPFLIPFVFKISP